MRQVVIVGNWKMNLDRQRSVALAEAVAREASQFVGVEIAVCPPFPYLDAVGAALGGSPVGLGAQNVYDKPSGAFTGEISVPMLVDLGCRYVILGHSERRQWFRETNSDVSKKAKSVFEAGLTPIVCVGETLEQRESGQTENVIGEQFEGSLAGLPANKIAGLVIAYEPVWAIGTGKVATPEQAEAVHAELRRLLENRYNSEVAAAVRIQYGGSVKPDNAAELLAQPNIDGALVGGASLVAEDFVGIVAAAAKLVSG